MDQAQRLKLLQKTGKTVFSAVFLRQIWQLPVSTFKVTVKRMVDKGLLLRLSRGVYALSDDYNLYELANTLVTPSYLSFHSALFYHGVSFQESAEIQSAAKFNYRREIDGRTYVYYRMKKDLLYNSSGLITTGHLTIAAVERAIVDSFYVRVSPNLDNPDKINPARLQTLAEKYPLRVKRKVQSIL